MSKYVCVGKTCGAVSCLEQILHGSERVVELGTEGVLAVEETTKVKWIKNFS